MDERTKEVQLGSRLASELSQLLEHASKQWKSINFDMSNFSDLKDVLPDLTLKDLDGDAC